MSDFFTRLAERTLGLAPTIQPITPSLFASEPDLPSEISEEREASVVADNFSGNADIFVPTQDVAAHLTYSTQLTHAPSMPMQHKIPQPFSITEPAIVQRQSQPALASRIERQATQQPDSLTTYRETLATEATVQPTQRGSQHTQTVAPTPITQTQTPPFVPVDVQTLRMARRSGEITEPTPTLLTRSVTNDPTTHITHISTAQTTSDQPLTRAQQTTRTATPHEQIVSQQTLVGVPASNLPSTTGFPSVQQMQPLQQTQQPQPETKSAKPDIQVTIGRVEVRAVTTPPTGTRPQQRSDKPPAMSLDEYLRQQERGGSRR